MRRKVSTPIVIIAFIIPETGLAKTSGINRQHDDACLDELLDLAACRRICGFSAPVNVDHRGLSRFTRFGHEEQRWNYDARLALIDQLLDAISCALYFSIRLHRDLSLRDFEGGQSARSPSRLFLPGVQLLLAWRRRALRTQLLHALLVQCEDRFAAQADRHLP